MNEEPTALGILLALIAALAGHALGQQEQWLQYRTSAETYEFLGGTNGQSQAPTTSPPKGLVLPDFARAEQLFAEWNTPAVDGGVWIALDRSKENGPYDLIYLDADLDGTVFGPTVDPVIFPS